MDFVSFPGARDAERNGRKRENQAQNRLSGAVGEVRKFPHEPAKTRGDTRDRPRKNPNSDELGFCIWWTTGNLNSLPQVAISYSPASLTQYALEHPAAHQTIEALKTTLPAAPGPRLLDELRHGPP